MGVSVLTAAPFCIMFPDITAGPRELIESDTNKVGLEPIADEKPRTLLTVDIDDTTLISLKNDWTQKWNIYWTAEEKVIKEAEDYWKGIQYTSIEFQANKRPIVDNLIFESLETFLPEATKRNPEPVVTIVNSIEGNELARNVKNILQDVADQKHLRLKLKRQTRYWSLYKLGALKVGWTPGTREIFIDAIRTAKFILDKDGTIDDGGVYTGEYLGEKKEATAEKLKQMFPEKADVINTKSDNQDGTKIQYIEWWTKELLFFTLEDQVLDKYRNPHWNYDEQQSSTDEYGNPTEVSVAGNNHFETPQMPYVFLSVFNLGKHPLDETSLIIQNLTTQDRINTTLRQIVKNVKKMNSGSAFAGEAFSKEEAAEAQGALDDGDGVWVPTGDISKAFKPYQGTPMPSDVFNHLVDMRSELRNIFGVKGSTAQGIASEETVRGKVIVGQKDSTRIGGGVTEYIEQSADRTFNWVIQLMMVYFEEQDYVNILGPERGMRTYALMQNNPSRINVSVKEGSMLPKNELTEANQAIDLATANLLSPIDLYKALDYPDPLETAKNLFLWNNMPQMLFPEMGQSVQPQGTEMTPEVGIPSPVETPQGAPPLPAIM